MALLRAVDVDLIAQFEGFRPWIYDDARPDRPYAGGPVGGTLTIGYGDTDAGVLERYANGITEPEAKELLALRADEYAVGVLAQLARTPTANQLGALTSLAYNIGLGGFYESTVRRRFNEGDVDGAAQAFGMWTKSDGRTLQGLVDRRQAEIAYFLTPDDDQPPTPSTPPAEPAPKEEPTMRILRLIDGPEPKPLYMQSGIAVKHITSWDAYVSLVDKGVLPGPNGTWTDVTQAELGQFVVVVT